MKPAPFQYCSPRTTEEALMLLRHHRGEARILAGGQSLVPILNFRLGRFAYLIDINGIEGLSYIRVAGDELRIGAMTRHRQIETSAVAKIHAPLLVEATRSIAHLPVRTRGTIGGSLAHADPAAEYPAILVALAGSVIARSRESEREIAASDLFQGMFTTALAPDELLVEIRIPALRKNQVFGFEEFARRPGDLAVVGVAASLDLAGELVETARVVAFGVEGSPRRVPEAERILQGKPWHDAPIEAAADAARGIPAETDIHATADLRRHLAGVLTRRVLMRARHSRGAAA
jgi:carbon-monoxide dehydrogenase medium subunit